MDNTVVGIFERTLNNCMFYEKEKKHANLLNEIGVLRGISYVMQLTGECPHAEEKYMYYIQLQNDALTLPLPLGMGSVKKRVIKKSKQ